MIVLTTKAEKQIASLLEKRGTPEAYLRLGVKTAGCSGLTYVMEYAEAPEEMDEVVEVGGVKILVDPKSLIYLMGTEIDYEEDVLQSGFTFKNPNKKGECGCGSSFTV